MSNYFDKALHYLGRNNLSTFVMNLGAMDGEMFDEMIGYTRMYNFKGIYVEPIPYLFEKLKKNIGGDNFFENSAISDYNGEIEMMTIDQEVIDTGLVHSCFYGMSAVYPPKNGLGSEFDRPTVEKYGKIVKVSCITFEDLLSKYEIQNFDVVKIDAEGHDYKIFKQIDLKKYSPKIVRLEWINLEEDEQKDIIDIFNQHDYVFEITGQDIVGLPRNFFEKLDIQPFAPVSQKSEESNITLVTGLWDLGRNNLSEGWSRSYEEHYLKKFDQLLQIDANLIVFGDKELESFVFQRRNQNNTQFIIRDLSWFQSEFYQKIQDIRTSESWLSQAGWLRESTQARLEGYNPLVMSKMFLLNDARIMDKFSSRYMFWIDAGLTNTVHPGYFTHDKVQNNLSKWIKKFSFVCFPYEANTEIHGFSYPKINEYASNDVKLVARGGFFGGPKHTISQMNNLYYDLMRTTLHDGLMGTEESLFSILLYRNKELINYFEIEGNGLMGKFFEDLKNDTLEIKTKGTSPNKMTDTNKTSLYVIGFNSPNQLRTLIQSMIEYDRNYIDQPKKYLLNNSTDRSTDKEYQDLCEEWGFEIIGTGENLGICGGRQFIAEHFEKTDQDFMLFFEDDMFFYPKEGEFCRNGFGRKVADLYWKSLEIISNGGYDFLKLNFSEFFGDNSTQWSWYNVPQDYRNSRWPLNPRLPKMGLDPNAPKTEFKNIRSHKGLAWADGEIYYSNWPQIVSKEGNRKMFLETKWAHPFEQTWMSYIYQETMKGSINPAILLLTPTEHNRFDHYAKELRKES